MSARDLNNRNLRNSRKTLRQPRSYRSALTGVPNADSEGVNQVRNTQVAARRASDEGLQEWKKNQTWNAGVQEAKRTQDAARTRSDEYLKESNARELANRRQTYHRRRLFDTDVPISESRKRDLVKCITKTAIRDRINYGLEDVTFSSPLGPKQLGRLREFLADRHDVDDVETLKTHAALSGASEVLCRWPRPKEIARLAKMMDPAADTTYYTGLLFLRADDSSAIGSLVGPKGRNLNQLTKRYGLLYIWVSSPTQNRRWKRHNNAQAVTAVKHSGETDGEDLSKFYAVLVYGTDQKYVNETVREIKTRVKHLEGVQVAGKYAYLVNRKLEYGENMGADDVPGGANRKVEKISLMNPKADEYVPVPQQVLNEYGIPSYLKDDGFYDNFTTTTKNPLFGNNSRTRNNDNPLYAEENNDDRGLYSGGNGRSRRGTKSTMNNKTSAPRKR